MQYKKNNKGMTLLELMVSMAISAIVIIMIISFINAAFHVFRKTNDEVNLQMEAQTVLNQTQKLMMEAENEWSATGTDGSQRFFIQRADNDYVIVFHAAQKKLYLVETDETNYPSVAVTEQDNLLAEYVTQISIDSVDTDGDGIAEDTMKNIKIKLALGDETYEASKEVSLRNFTPTPTP